MNEKHLPSFLMLLAGSITSVMCIVMKKDVLWSLFILLMAMVSFCIIGVIARNIITKTKDSFQKQQALTDEDKEDPVSNEGEETDQEEGDLEEDKDSHS